MIDHEQIEKVITLRAKGFSFEKISKKLNISKPTLIKLSRDYEKEISNQKFLNVEFLLKKYQISNEYKIKFLIKLLNKINQELLNKDVSKLDLKDLLKMRYELDSELHDLLKKLKYYTSEAEDIQNNFIKLTQREITLNLE